MAGQARVGEKGKEGGRLEITQELEMDLSGDSGRCYHHEVAATRREQDESSGGTESEGGAQSTSNDAAALGGQKMAACSMEHAGRCSPGNAADQRGARDHSGQTAQRLQGIRGQGDECSPGLCNEGLDSDHNSGNVGVGRGRE
eukprot:67239-Rhodomonas_salina.3